MIMQIPNEVQEYLYDTVQRLTAVMPVKTIWLYGSYAKGTYNQYSDLDLFIVTNDKSKRRIDWIREASGAIDRNFGLPVEIVVNYEDDFEERCKGTYTLEREIVKTGLKIYEQNITA